MLIHMSCPDCGWVMFNGVADNYPNTTEVLMICPRCKAQIQLKAVKLRDGVNAADLRKTTDLKGNLLIRDAE